MIADTCALTLAPAFSPFVPLLACDATIAKPWEPGQFPGDPRDVYWLANDCHRPVFRGTPEAMADRVHQAFYNRCDECWTSFLGMGCEPCSSESADRSCWAEPGEEVLARTFRVWFEDETGSEVETLGELCSSNGWDLYVVTTLTELEIGESHAFPENGMTVVRLPSSDPDADLRPGPDAEAPPETEEAPKESAHPAWSEHWDAVEAEPGRWEIALYQGHSRATARAYAGLRGQTFENQAEGRDTMRAAIRRAIGRS